MSPIFKAVCIESSINSYYPDGVVKGNIYNISIAGKVYDLPKDKILYYIINDDGKVCGVFGPNFFKTLPDWRDECIDSILED